MKNVQTPKVLLRPISFLDGYIAQISSVTAAACVFTIICIAESLCTDFVFLAGASILPKIKELAEAALMHFFIGWVFVFLFTIIPFSIVLKISNQFRICALSLFLVSGVATAIVLSCMISLVPNFGFNVEGDIGEYVVNVFLHFLPIFIVCGCVAGYTCWKVLCFRRARQSSL